MYSAFASDGSKRSKPYENRQIKYSQKVGYRCDRLTSVDSIGPGAMMLDVMPRGPYSIATEFDRESMPALATDT
jgi:hypothetical protein